MIATCPVCNKEFTPKRRNQKFCRSYCLKRDWKLRHRDSVNEWQRKFFRNKSDIRLSGLVAKRCPQCGGEFQALYDRLHPYKTYCSTKCRHRWNQRRTKARDREVLKNPSLDPERYWKVLNRKRVQDANYSSLHRGCKRCSGHHIHLGDWLAVKERYGNRCVMCKRPESLQLPMTIDHIVALANGGHNTVDNIQPLCRSCNSRKGNRW